jgi:hypothetical protein
MSLDMIDDGLAILVQRAMLAKYAIYAFIALSIGMAGIELGEAAGLFQLEALPSDAHVMGIYVVVFGNMLATFISFVLVGMWIHRAHKNLFDAGFDGLEYTPGWSVGWFFIPFANLVKPFQAMKELWQASLAGNDWNPGDETPGTMIGWWACWLGGNILGNIDYPPVLLISYALSVAAGIFLVQIISHITMAQHSSLHIEATFA